MKRKELLKLISMVNEFDIKEQDGRLIIEHREVPLQAIINISTGECRYYRTGCYDSGVSNLEIDLPELKALEHVATVLSKEDTEVTSK